MRKIAFRLVALIVGTFAALLIGEIAVRVFHLAPVFDVVFQDNIQLSKDPVLQYELRPGSQDGNAVISTAGLRDREFAAAKPQDTYRIVVIGDSVTFGFQLKPPRAFPKRLEAMLNRYSPSASPTYEVLNLGVNGYNITQVVESLRVKGLRFNPDLIIYAYVLNDPQGYSLEAKALAVLLARAEKPLRLARYFPRSRLLRMLSAQVRRMDPDYGRFYLKEPGYAAFDAGTCSAYFHRIHHDEKTWTRVRDGMATLARLTAQPKRIPVLVAVIPINTGRGFTPYPLQDIHDKVTTEARNNGLQTMDLVSAFQSVSIALDGNCYRDFLHPNEKGDEVLAVALLTWLSESHLLPGAGLDFERMRRGHGLDAKIAAALTVGKRE